MRSATLIIVLACVARTHAKEEQNSMEKVADDLVDDLFNRVLKASPLVHEDLDSTTLEKPGLLQVSPAIGLRPANPVLGAHPKYVPGVSTSPLTNYHPQLGAEAVLSHHGQATMTARRTLSTFAEAEGASLMGSNILEGKVALVTGASRGIGEAIAQTLAKAGATVIGTATSEDGAKKISERITGDLKGTGMKLDVTNQEDVDTVLKAINAEYGGVDILINNAGITKDGLMMMMKEPQWDDVIDTNLNSVFKMTKACLRGMTKKRWGRIVSVSSVVGSMGNAGQANYAAAKAGMEGFTRALAREVASRSITVNAVAPGFIKSDMTDKLKDEWKDKLLESVPAGRLGTPQEVADAVLYLSSPFSQYVTGHTLHVNGGMYM